LNSRRTSGCGYASPTHGSNPIKKELKHAACTRETVKPTELMEQEQFELDFLLMGRTSERENFDANHLGCESFR